MKVTRIRRKKRNLSLTSQDDDEQFAANRFRWELCFEICVRSLFPQGGNFLKLSARMFAEKSRVYQTQSNFLMS